MEITKTSECGFLICTAPKTRDPFRAGGSDIYDQGSTTANRDSHIPGSPNSSKSTNAHKLQAVTTILLREFLATSYTIFVTPRVDKTNYVRFFGVTLSCGFAAA